MYYGTIIDDEVKAFHKDVKLTASYTELNGLASGALFDKTKTNKLIPKFYSDHITGNDNVTIIEDLLVIYMSNGDLDSLYFSSEEEHIEFGLLHEIQTVNNKKYLKLHLYNSTSLFNLNNFSFNITNTTIGLNENAVTDKYGNYIIEITGTSGTFTVIGSNGQTITFGGS